jgi:hypothetical protein
MGYWCNLIVHYVKVYILMADVHKNVLVVQYILDKKGNCALLDYPYHNFLRNNPEVHSSHLLCGISLESCLDKQVCYVLL